MKLWSRGLGRTEVQMDFRRYKVIKATDTEGVYIIGSMQDPVNWEFRITLGPDDVPGMMKMFFSFAMFKLIIKNLHRYIQYLFNRHLYREKNGENLERKVNSAYEQMMSGRRPGLSGTGQRQAKTENIFV